MYHYITGFFFATSTAPKMESVPVAPLEFNVTSSQRNFVHKILTLKNRAIEAFIFFFRASLGTTMEWILARVAGE